ncbi:MarR family winged helix-turn-helix transcriptional regulator [Chitinophaga sp. Cy-1792]|uniref:MarR family winged helix-turn-helix transcriptional regulator n=1 Tax=Chitinophaga sp. Cy-1792 TaxID=2608339 RepID=UPI001424A344|nr:MarR family transcriptional regulator [Chitinophaga sp. Cy-1792]NIG53625.1 MarR family transcriptional regulator [Chitinophaga sp. Cy-1792]
MSFYASLGHLVFGTRLRRLSEYFLMEVNKIYEQEGIPFDASWFPVFYILSKGQPMPMIDIADQLEISHSAVSQMVTNLRKRGLVKTDSCNDDRRRQLVAFTPEGETLLKRVQPIWKAITEAMEEMADEHKHSKLILTAIAELEQSVQETPLADRIKQKI